MRDIQKLAKAFNLPDNEQGTAAIEKISGVTRQALDSATVVVGSMNLTYSEAWYVAQNLKSGFLTVSYVASTLLRKYRGNMTWWLGFYRGYTGHA